MELQELFENAVERPLVVRPGRQDVKIEATNRVMPRWFIKGGGDASILVASLKAFDEQDEADARLLAHAYNHFPALLEAAEQLLAGHAGAKSKLARAVKAAQKVNV